MRAYQPNRIVIIGAVAAGMSAASRARRNDPRAEITVIQKEDDVSYGACGLPYFIDGKIQDSNSLIARTVADFKAQNIHILNAHEALYFQHHKKKLYSRNLISGVIIERDYDKLIIATGAKAKSLAVPGAHLKNVFSLRTLFDGRQINTFIRENNPKSVLIIGSGYVGLEMAEAFKQREIKTTLIEENNQLLNSVDEEIAAMVQKELQLNECAFLLNTSIKQISGMKQVEQVVLDNGGMLQCDCVLNATGIEPNIEFAKQSGVHLGNTGAIAINAKMETNLHGVYAAGDCCEVKNLVSNRYEYLPLGTTANKQGRVAGDNASGRFAQFRGIVGTAALKVFDLHIARTGLSQKQAEKLNLKYDSVLINAGTRPQYSGCRKDIMIKLLFLKHNGQVLGAQIAGGEGVAKRIDVFATALHQKMTVFDMADLDLSYAPPFAPVWDPVLIAANQAIKKIKLKK